MNEKYLGSCDDFKERFDLQSNCCDSCHEDSNMGYNLIELEFDDGYYSVCCWVSNAYRDKVDK